MYIARRVRLRLLLGAVAFLVAWIAWLYWNASKANPETSPSVANGSDMPQAAKRTPQGEVEALFPENAPAKQVPLEDVDIQSPRLLRNYGSSDRTGKDDLELVGFVIQRFWLLLKDPDLLSVGSNEDIMKSLTGKNPEGIAFVSPDNFYLNEEGQLLDRWGTPLFFHALSMTRIEVRSAGPDKDMYTGDDVLIVAQQ